MQMFQWMVVASGIAEGWPAALVGDDNSATLSRSAKPADQRKRSKEPAPRQAPSSSSAWSKSVALAPAVERLSSEYYGQRFALFSKP